jgi:hypothetical protein
MLKLIPSRLLRQALDLGLICPVPPGIVPDNSAMFGLLRLLANVNNYSLALSAPINAGAGFTITAAQYNQGVINVTAASGGFNATLPTTAQLLSAMGNTVQLDGTYCEPFHLMNNGSGQTGTLVAGDANTTIIGTATIATNTVREFLVTVNAANAAGVITITFQNFGTRAL